SCLSGCFCVAPVRFLRTQTRGFCVSCGAVRFSILHYLANYPGCNHAELVSALNDPHDRTPLGTHVEKALPPALRRLETLEGFAFEKLIRCLHGEMPRKSKGDFELSGCGSVTGIGRATPRIALRLNSSHWTSRIRVSGWARASG